MERLQRILIEKQCARLVNQYHHLFNKELSLIVDLFAPGGTLNLGGWELGPDHDAMRERLRQGSRNMLRGKEVVLNTMSNVVVDVIDDDNASGMSYDVMWETPYPDDDFAGRPAPIRVPKFMVHWADTYRRVGDQWKFGSRKMEFDFYADWARK